MPPTNSGRLPIVQTLRGLAAFIVAWYHLAVANPNVDTSITKYTAPDGGLGVTIFFVISGFVLPYSLWKGGYVLPDYGRFIVKRIARLDPPYFASILIALAVAYFATLSPIYRGVPFSVTPLQLLLHIGYLDGFFGQRWIIFVYWTLAIEFQYYLVLGLLFPLLRSGNRWVFAGFAALCAVSQYLVFKPDFLPFQWPWFLMGIVVFRYQAKIIQASESLAWIAVLCGWAAFVMQPVAVAVGAASALSIMYLTYENSVTRFLADISYSLYLIHIPIGNRTVNLVARFAVNPFGSLLVAAVGMFASIVAAYFMYRWIEKPAQQWAGKIRYRRDSPTAGAGEPPQRGMKTLVREEASG